MRPGTGKQRSVIKRSKEIFSADTGRETMMGVGQVDGAAGPFRWLELRGEHAAVTGRQRRGGRRPVLLKPGRRESGDLENLSGSEVTQAWEIRVAAGSELCWDREVCVKTDENLGSKGGLRSGAGCPWSHGVLATVLRGPLYLQLWTFLQSPSDPPFLRIRNNKVC